MSRMTIHGNCKQSLTKKINDGANHIYDKKDCQNPDDTGRMLIHLFNSELMAPQQLAGWWIVSDEIHSECRLRQSINNLIMKFFPDGQRKNAKTEEHHR